jgi:hypothetical protein
MTVERLKQRYAGKIDSKTMGQAAFDSARIVRKLMKEWDPVSSSRGDVKGIMGVPTFESDDVLQYRFDGGRAGWIWQFTIRADRVEKVERISLE